MVLTCSSMSDQFEMCGIQRPSQPFELFITAHAMFVLKSFCGVHCPTAIEEGCCHEGVFLCVKQFWGSANIHMSTRAEYCSVVRRSVVLTSTASGFNVAPDGYIGLVFKILPN